jgi:hypothetical protein
MQPDDGGADVRSTEAYRRVAKNGTSAPDFSPSIVTRTVHPVSTERQGSPVVAVNRRGASRSEAAPAPTLVPSPGRERPRRYGGIAGGNMNDSGHETVGQALLISAVAIGALTVAQLSGLMLRSFDRLITVLG